MEGFAEFEILGLGAGLEGGGEGVGVRGGGIGGGGDAGKEAEGVEGHGIADEANEDGVPEDGGGAVEGVEQAEGDVGPAILAELAEAGPNCGFGFGLRGWLWWW